MLKNVAILLCNTMHKNCNKLSTVYPNYVTVHQNINSLLQMKNYTSFIKEPLIINMHCWDIKYLTNDNNCNNKANEQIQRLSFDLNASLINKIIIV